MTLVEGAIQQREAQCIQDYRSAGSFGSPGQIQTDPVPASSRAAPIGECSLFRVEAPCAYDNIRIASSSAFDSETG